MKFLDIGNISLTQGESSDEFEISSNISLSEYKGKYRISDESGVKHEGDLAYSKEVKNNDSIVDDEVVISYFADKYDYNANVRDPSKAEVFEYKIEIIDVTRDKLKETATIKGKIYKSETQDTIQPPQTTTPPATDTQNPDNKDESKDNTQKQTTGLSVAAVITKEVQKPIENALVTISLTSTQKEITKFGTGVSQQDGTFTIEINTGATIKIPAKNSLVFNIPNEVTAKIVPGRYYCVVTIYKEELDGKVSYSREVIQTKLDILKPL